jgi:hypothetical protein
MKKYILIAIGFNMLFMQQSYSTNQYVDITLDIALPKAPYGYYVSTPTKNTVDIVHGNSVTHGITEFSGQTVVNGKIFIFPYEQDSNSIDEPEDIAGSQPSQKPKKKTTAASKDAETSSLSSSDSGKSSEITLDQMPYIRIWISNDSSRAFQDYFTAKRVIIEPFDLQLGHPLDQEILNRSYVCELHIERSKRDGHVNKQRLSKCNHVARDIAYRS